MGSAILGAALFVSSWMARRFRRYAIRGNSMLPALCAGDYVIVDRRAYRSDAPKPGHVVVARDPRDPSRELVKRVHGYETVAGAWLEGDAQLASTDSRAFGHVAPALIEGRVLFRYYPRLTRF